MNNREALEARIANGMVDNLVRHKNGEPFYVRGEDGVLVPNPALKGASPNGKFEGKLAKAATVFTTTPQYPKGRAVSAQYVRGEGDMLVLNQATQSSNKDTLTEHKQSAIVIVHE